MELSRCPHCKSEAEHIHVFHGEDFISCSAFNDPKICSVAPQVRGSSFEECLKLWEDYCEENKRYIKERKVVSKSDSKIIVIQLVLTDKGKKALTTEAKYIKK